MAITDQKFIETIMFDSSIDQVTRSTFIAKILVDARYRPTLELFVKELCNNSLDIPEIKSIHDECMEKVPWVCRTFVKSYIYKGNDVVLYENVVKPCLLEQFEVPKVVRKLSISIPTSVEIKAKLIGMLYRHILSKILCAKIEGWSSLDRNDKDLNIHNLLTMIEVAVKNTVALSKDTRLISNGSEFTDELVLVSDVLGGLTDEETNSSSSCSSYESCAEILPDDCSGTISKDNISEISDFSENDFHDCREIDDNSLFINNISLALGVVIMVLAILLLTFTSIGLLNCSLVVMSATLPVFMMRERYLVDKFEIENPVQGTFESGERKDISHYSKIGDDTSSLNISLSNVRYNNCISL